MELFNKKFVYFMWDEVLEGEEVFMADDMESLIKAVNNNNSRHKVSHTVNNSNLGKEAIYDLKVPFRNKDTCTVHPFAYYDPNYECKVAYAEGKIIQISGDNNIWVDWEGEHEPDWESLWSFRIKLEEESVILIRPYKDCDELINDYNNDVENDKDVTPEIWIKHKIDGRRILIVEFGKDFVKCGSKSKPVSLDMLLSNYTFLNDSPIGVLEQ